VNAVRVSQGEAPHKQSKRGRISTVAMGSDQIEQLLYRNVQRFRGGLGFKAQRLWYFSQVEAAGEDEIEEQVITPPSSSVLSLQVLEGP